jgi:putative acetyltransferase
MTRSESVTVRLAVPGDEDAMQRIHTRSVRELCAGAYSAEQIEALLRGRTPAGYRPAIDLGEMLMAEVDGAAAGFGHAIPGEVYACFVDPAFSGRGVGRAIVAAASAKARKGWKGPLRLEATLNAVPFYERLGFRADRPGAAVRSGIEIPTMHMIEDESRR